MKLIDSLVRQVGGALTISRDAGLRFEIRLPT
jgi:two-component sensor histidine kinase